MVVKVGIGDKIRILKLKDEENSDYIGREGYVNGFNKDCYGHMRIYGSWGGIFIYLGLDSGDEFEVLEVCRARI